MMGLFKRTKPKDVNTERLQILLDMFEYPHLLELCTDVIKKSPEMLVNERLERIEYLEFIWAQYRKGTVTFPQVMDFAVERGIVPKDFFD